MDAALADGAARGESGQRFTRRRVKQSEHRPVTGSRPPSTAASRKRSKSRSSRLVTDRSPTAVLRDVPVDDGNLESAIDTGLLDYYPYCDVQHKQIVSAWLIRTIERNITYELKIFHARAKSGAAAKCVGRHVAMAQTDGTRHK